MHDIYTYVHFLIATTTTARLISILGGGVILRGTMVQ